MMRCSLKKPLPLFLTWADLRSRGVSRADLEAAKGDGLIDYRNRRGGISIPFEDLQTLLATKHHCPEE